MFAGFHDQSPLLTAGIPTAFFSCKYFPLYTRELLGCLLGISLLGALLGEIPAGAMKMAVSLAAHALHQICNEYQSILGTKLQLNLFLKMFSFLLLRWF